jgi:hypothetical protein
MFQLSVWCEKWVAAGHNSVIGNQFLFANNRKKVRWVVLCLPHDGACTESFENFREISLKGDPSNDITLNPPLFSLVNTFKMIPYWTLYPRGINWKTPHLFCCVVFFGSYSSIPPTPLGIHIFLLSVSREEGVGWSQIRRRHCTILYY